MDNLPSYLSGTIEQQGASPLVSETGAWVPFTMRVDAAPFSDVRVRQALRLIVDRQQMIDQALNGFGILGNDLYSPFDPAYARDLPQRTQDIASSTSGFGMTEMAVEARTPHRLVVAHPFNPPYLIPLVEVVGGEKTAADVVTWTAAFFRHIGKSVITMDREVPGFIANRLQEALWREALHMVANGEATVEQIDASITEGPGLRWAFHGPMLTFHLAGGPGGMAHMLDHFGPSLLAPWTRLAAPDLTPELRERVVRGCAEEAGSRGIADLVRERDRALVDLLRVLGKAPGGRVGGDA